MFENKEIGSLGFCKDCILGKSSMARFETAVHTTKEKLRYIHSDLWGPIQMTSLYGCWYFMTCIYNFSNIVLVYTLESNDEDLERFKR